MRLLLILTLATAVPTTPAPLGALTGFVDGRRLDALCHTAGTDADAAASLCFGYIVGSVDQVLAREARRPAAQRMICLPKGLSVEQMVEAIARNPAHRPRAPSQAASVVVRDALEALYPCKLAPDIHRR